jgi:hypothetical protein
MTERWDQVKEVVAAALEHSPGEREAFIREACGEGDSLRQEVESLVSHHDEVDALLEHPLRPDTPILGAYWHDRKANWRLPHSATSG